MQETIEYMNAKQYRLLATMERKHKLMSGASAREDLEVESELHEASEEMRKLTMERKAEAEELLWEESVGGKEALR